MRSLSSRVIANDRVFALLQRSLRVSFIVRNRLDRNLLRLLAMANIPTYADLARVDEQVSLLEEDLALVRHRVATLVHELEERQG